MILSPQECNELLLKLRDPNQFAHLIRIPENEPIYQIDLDKRKIEAPAYLSVEADQNAEIIWFKVDRFYDNIDLYSGVAWIQYINADKEERLYAAPLLVGTEQFGNEQILIPWVIGKEVAKTAGTIQFSFQFFQLSEDSQRFLYILNTQPSSSRVLNGMHVDPFSVVEEDSEDEAWIRDQFSLIMQKIAILSRENILWTDV